MQTFLKTTIQTALFLGAAISPAAAFELKPIGTYSTGVFDDGAAEISAYDPVTQRLFITNGSTSQIDILSISDPTKPTLISSISLAPYGGGANSVAFKNGVLAAAVENTVVQNPGSVVFFNADGGFLNSVTVGALPDMLTFTPDGKKVLVANEGEPNSDYTIDPEGSVSIVDLAAGVLNATVKTAGFTQFNNVALDPGIRVYGPNATPAQDFEPEYIAVSPDSKKAWVALQENNALGILNLETGEFEKLVALGFKDYSKPGNALDASDRDNAINITNYPNLFGMYQPDAIATFEASGKTFIISANEGDARDYDTFAEEARVRDLVLDPTAFPNAAELQANSALGRLNVTTTLGDTDGDGDYDELYTLGGRSFSIWDEDGKLVYDSGDLLEQIIAERIPEFFNADNAVNGFDSRSDNKGPEPEGVTVAQFGDQIFAFLGLERVSGVAVFDITNPTNPIFANYINNRDFSVLFDENEDGDPAPTPEQLAAVGDLGPEGLLFISAKDSPNGKDLLVLTNEVSGTTTIYTAAVPEPTTVLGLGVFGTLALRLRRKYQAKN
ncbi:MAG TPA: choice-of-anchor I family protein [Leptolyngbyaceae cyanobacterium M33_DOE_097]|uniref:PEP-CTERM sorting domain-containing protein n=1 Tax=Oscillatoriales cyanobacterium SpSt-418 TaxID=2282169 RepID=A0A7C3KJR6_9CYAN|nr:choice-of-anchor I family protein [Leptolyngbyaceae cyanobacterium M33_DOE_097]